MARRLFGCVFLPYLFGILKFVIFTETSFTGPGCRNNEITKDDKIRIRVGVILPFNDSRMFSYRRSFPALEIAIGKVRNQSLLQGKHIILKFADSKCSSKAAALAAFKFYNRREAQVLIGPVCDYSLAPVGRYTPEWNIPVITPGGMAHDFGQNKIERDGKEAEYPLLTRVGVTFDSLARYVTDVLSAHRFARFNVLYDPEGHSEVSHSFCYLAISALIKEVRTSGSFEYEFNLYKPGKNNSGEFYEKFLRDKVALKFSGRQFSFYIPLIKMQVWSK